jgi:SAM-dependent methyltransferase
MDDRPGPDAPVDAPVDAPAGGAAPPGFGAGTYGASFAEVYDAWYGDLPGTDEAVGFLADLAVSGPAGPVLELGIGTGRLALPLAERLAAHGRAVHGVDASPAMVELLRAKAGAAAIPVTVGDMAAADPAGPFALVFVALNTFFNLDTEAAQRRCLANVAARLVPGGRLVVEAAVPASGEDRARDHVGISTITADRLVLTATREDPASQTVTGQHVELVDGDRVRLRPWRIRWIRPDQLDRMAAEAGLILTHRYASWSMEPFSHISAQHVSVFRR